MPVKDIELRLGDRLRLKKVHPCGGWTWRVVRLGADIGLECETCGRHVLLNRFTLERRVKRVLEQGPERASESVETEPTVYAPATPGTVPLNIGETYEVIANIEIPTRLYYSTTVGSGTARVTVRDRFKVAELPAPGSPRVILDPVDTAEFDEKHVPGGVRANDTYVGASVEVTLAELFQSFRRLEV